MADTFSTDNPQYQDDQRGFDDLERPLAQDGTTPAAPPDDVSLDSKPANTDDPQTDTGIDAHERYDAGEATASGANAQHNTPHPEAEDERIA